MATSLLYEPQEFPVPTLPVRGAPHEDAAPLRTRRAQLSDAKAIHMLIHSYTYDGTLLHRSYREICENIHTFTVVETKDSKFLGCASLHVYGPHLAEVRSIVVRPAAAGRGAGSLIVQSLLQQAEEAGIRCVCLFTRIPAFFERFRFHAVEHRLLRDKIWKDCQHCSRRKSCDEIAMTIGELPPLHNTPAFESGPHSTQRDLVQLSL